MKAEMFTGLIQKVGRLIRFKNTAEGGIITIGYDPWDTPLAEGESVAVHGVCLTVARYKQDEFACDVLSETLARTNLASKRHGAALNLERSLRVGDNLGGHFVLGHVDGIGKAISFGREGKDWILKIECDKNLLSNIVPKGSIACDGVSLTVTRITTDSFEVNLIPFTYNQTTLGRLKAGDIINLETDMLGKYVRRYLSAGEPSSKLDIDHLRKAGFFLEEETSN